MAPNRHEAGISICSARALARTDRSAQRGLAAKVPAHRAGSPTSAATVATSERKMRGPRDTARKSADANLGVEKVVIGKGSASFKSDFFSYPN